MQRIDISENGINASFSINDDKVFRLLYMGVGNYDENPIPLESQGHLNAVEVAMTGANTDAHHGAKHLHHLCPTRPLYDSHTDTRNNFGRLLSFVLKTAVLKITVNYQFYDGISVVSSYTEVENISEEAVGIEYISSFCLGGLAYGDQNNVADRFELFVPHNAWCVELNWRKKTLREMGYCPFKSQNTTRIGISNTGTWSTKEYLPMGILYDNKLNRSILWQIEQNGSWNWEIGDSEYAMFLRLSGPSEQENSWWKNLAPGGKITSAAAAVAFSEGQFGAAVREMTEYRRIIASKHIDKNMTLVFNDYIGCLWANPTTEKELPIIEKAAEIGCEVYCVDGGWYSEGYWWPLVGEWQDCKARFPGGIKEVFDYIKAHGMKPGIWIEPEVMGITCPLVEEFMDCYFTHHGKPIIDNGRYQLDFRKQKVRDHLNSVIDRFVNEWGVEYIKFDYNINIGPGTETDADSAGDGLMQCNAAFLEWVDSLYERYPNLMIENCSSGGMRMEYQSLKHFSIQSISDSWKYFEFAYMSANVPTAVIPEQAGIWVTPEVAYSDGENVFAAVNGMLNRFYLSGQTAKLDEKQFALLKEAVDCHKKMRYDLIGSKPYFLNGLSHFEDEWHFGARLTKDSKKLYVSAGRLEGNEASKTVSLKEIEGKKQNARVIYPKGWGDISLADDALTVNLDEKSAVLIEIDIV